MQKKPKKITCTVGILTFNSEVHLERCLNSVKDFAEIVISDGGSTDKTLEIAKKYNCKIIQQSNPGNKIEDFSLERNRILDNISYDWFFYLDSDEIMSESLVDKIQLVTNKKVSNFLIYKVRYQLVDKTLNIHYKQFKNYYQTRLFNKRSGARFKKKMHERIYFSDKYKIGIIDDPWFVTLEDNLDFEIYKRKVSYRIGVMVEEADISNLNVFLNRGLFIPFKEILKHIIKIIYVRIRYRGHDLIPLRYEFYRIYSQILMMKKMYQRFMRFS